MYSVMTWMGVGQHTPSMRCPGYVSRVVAVFLRLGVLPSDVGSQVHGFVGLAVLFGRGCLFEEAFIFLVREVHTILLWPWHPRGLERRASGRVVRRLPSRCCLGAVPSPMASLSTDGALVWTDGSAAESGGR